MRRAVAALLLAALSACNGAPAADRPPESAAIDRDGLLEQHVAIPVAVSGSLGEKRLELTALVVRPVGAGPFPLAIVSHGSPRRPGQRPQMAADGLRGQARAFARRGWVAVVPLRRGYGETGGSWAEAFGSCANPSYYEAGLASAKDIVGAIDWARRLPYVDAGRIVAVGVSAGGFGSVAASTLSVPGLVAVVNFAGGRGSRGPDQVCAPAALVRAMARYGQRSRVPQLWIYAENDHFFGPDLARRMHEAFVAAGGRAEFVGAPPFGRDGHGLFGRPEAWSGYVDSFLRRQGLPATEPPALLTLRGVS